MPEPSRLHPPAPSRRRLLPTLSLLLAMALAGPAPAATQATDDAAMVPLIAGEFALQAGDLDEAARWYLQAARAAGDAGLAERATRIALLADDDAAAMQALKLWKAQAGATPGMLAAETTLALRRGKARAARRGLEALLREGGEDGWRHALVALDNGKAPEMGARLLGELVDDDALPRLLQPWLAFGGLAQRLGDDALAERIVAEVVRRFPGEPRVALLRASQLREAGKTEEARQVLAGMEDAARLVEELRMALAAEYDALGDQATAAKVLSRGPQDERSYGLRASLLARAEDKAGLGALYDELRRDSAEPDPARRLLLGQVAEFLERHPEALDWYRGVPGGPQRWTARLRSANVLHALDRKPEAFEALRALQGDATVDDDARRDAYLLEAELHAGDGDAAGELDAFARGLAAYPDDGALLYSRALAHERRDDIPRAEADFRRILVGDPENVTVLNALGYTLADRTTRYEEALQLIDRARVAEPDSGAIVDSYGWVLYRLGRHDEALVELRRAFALQKDPEIAAHLGEVLWMTGKKEEARKWFEEARRLDPENRSLRRALEKTGA